MPTIGIWIFNSTGRAPPTGFASRSGPLPVTQAARPPPGAHSPSPALRRSWTARAVRACSAALRPVRRLEATNGLDSGDGRSSQRPAQRGVLGRGHGRTRATNTLAPGASGKHIAGNMRLVLDTSVLVAAVRSPSGASAEILRRVLRAELIMLASVPLVAEYEAVAPRPDHLARAAATVEEIENLLDALATRLEAVEIRFLWRPQLTDADDEMVLETAVNG